jgi:hypothetical protein
MEASMSRQVFVSYGFKNAQIARSVKSFFQDQGGPCEGKPVYVTRDVSVDGPDAIDNEILSVMGPCEAALFVIGNDDHNSPWIEREAKIAVGKGFGIVAVRIKNTTGGLPPQLKEAGVPFVAWDPDPVCEALNHAARIARKRRTAQ